AVVLPIQPISVNAGAVRNTTAHSRHLPPAFPAGITADLRPFSAELTAGRAQSGPAPSSRAARPPPGKRSQRRYAGPRAADCPCSGPPAGQPGPVLSRDGQI